MFLKFQKTLESLFYMLHIVKTQLIETIKVHTKAKTNQQS